MLRKSTKKPSPRTKPKKAEPFIGDIEFILFCENLTFIFGTAKKKFDERKEIESVETRWNTCLKEAIEEFDRLNPPGY